MKLDDLSMLSLQSNYMKYDPTTKALCYALDKQLIKIAEATEKIAILSKINEMPDAVCDELAWQFDAEEYNVDYSLEIKRNIILNSILVHKWKGTRYACERVLQSIWGKKSKIIEWFNDDGLAYTFKVKLLDPCIDLIQLKEFFRILYNVKNARSHILAIVLELPSFTTDNNAYLHRIKFAFKHDNLGFAYILLDGAKDLDSTWQLGYRESKKGLKFHRFIVSTSVRQAKRKDNVLLNGSRLLNGEFVLGGDCSDLYRLRIGIGIKNNHTITSTVKFRVGNYNFLLDGRFSLDGEKQLGSMFNLSTAIKANSSIKNNTSTKCYLMTTPLHKLEGGFCLDGSKKVDSGITERVKI